MIATLPPVEDAIAKNDRDGLGKLLAAPWAAMKAQGIPLISFWQAPATSFYRVHAPKTFGDDASARRTTVVESIKAGRPIVGVEPGREALSIFGMTPVMHDGKTLANVDIGVAFGKEFVDRAKKRFGIDLAVHSFDGQSFKRLSSTFGDTVVATQDELKSVMDGAAVLRDAVLDGHEVELYLGQIKNYAGEPVAVLEIIKDTSDYAAAAATAQRNLILGVVAILAAAILLAFLLGRGLSRPLTAITAVMNRLSSGDTNVTIPGSERRDELGTMAKAGRRVPPQHDRDLFAARGAGGRQGEGGRPTSRCCNDRWPTASKPTSRAWSPPSRDRRATCSALPARSRRASTAPPNGPRLQPPRRRRRRPASMQLQRQRRNSLLRSPRSAARSTIPAGSPTMPWRRLRRPPRW